MNNQTATVEPGVTHLLREQLHLVSGARVGIVAGPASVDARLTNVIDALHEHRDVRVTALFGAEHGVRGDLQAGMQVADETDPATGLPVYSLYGESKKPTQAMLQHVDVLVVDLFDVGCRYWTFLYTMAYVLQAAAEYNKRVVILDRPNPIGGTVVEGNILDPEFSSFVGLYPIPIRTGLTLGEAALMFNQEFSIGADVDVVPCIGWTRDMWHGATGLPFVPPSPNTPTLDTLTLYPGTCLIEGTTLSEGRGTTRPFELIGAPWVDARRLADALNERELPGVRFRPAYFVPTFGKHQGTQCGGVQIHITSREQIRSVDVGVHLLHALKEHHPSEFAWRPPYREGGRHFVDLLSGSSELRTCLDAGTEPEAILSSWARARAEFESLRQSYLLYNDTEGESLNGKRHHP